MCVLPMRINLERALWAAHSADQAIEAFDRAMKSSNAAVGYTASDRETVVQMSELNTIIRKNRISERLAALKSEDQ